MKKSEIVIPVRTRNSGYDYWLDAQYFSPSDSCGSAWLRFALWTDDPDNYMTASEREVYDMGIYVWFSDNSVSLDIRMHVGQKMTVFDCESRLKLLKKLTAKAAKNFPLCSFVKNTTVHEQLTKLLDALGVKRALDYSGASLKGTPLPIGIAVKRIAETLDKCKEDLVKKAA